MASVMASRSSTAAITKRAPARVAARAAATSRRALVVKAHCGDKPLVGSVAPDFKAQAVYDQEFMEVSLSKYRGKYVVLFF